MAISNSKPYLVPLIFKAFLLLLLLNNVKSQSDSLSFNFPSFSSLGKDEIIFQGGASLTNVTLQLCKIDEDGFPVQWCAGQALYSKPVHLWDRATGGLASFYSEFTFRLKITGNFPADGFAFFLAPPDSQVKDAAEYLGLFSSATATDPSKNQVVAVEFDTWPNFFSASDPLYHHIGIDVNSIDSVATKKWEGSDMSSGKIATARISYDASSKILNVVLSYPDGGVYTLSSVVDLSANLPEWVRVGFSASTGLTWDLTDYVLSWYFSSSLESTSFSSAVKPEIIRTVV